eukprot:TRINITY_DN10021_c0_g1_i1.p1 TRINITY_DN10021_c0_g1~~TRINITY_DN10021_c0_g1_i1.p1  ORF type:complete len:241 (+),score=35.45 TRINITY_DN10021_c0_g1_i1:2-724(+)
MDTIDFVFLNRNLAKDKKLLEDRLGVWVADKLRVWLFFFPEGTDFTPKKHADSLEYAKKEGVPSYNHLLIPRSNGFITCVSVMRPNLEAVYDLTIAYADEITPTFKTGLLGIAPKQAHVHIRRFEINEMPEDQQDLKLWLQKCYKEKDELLDHFAKNKSFPEGERKEVLRNNRVFLYSWFCFWVLLAGFWTYLICVSKTFLIVVIIGIIFQVASATSHTVRVWRGIDPKYDDDEKTKKQN